MEEEAKSIEKNLERAERTLAEYNRIIKESDEIYKDTARIFGMSDSAFWILYTIRESGRRVTQSEICGAVYQPKQTINSALKKLEREGIIELCAGKDRRSKEICLTAQGEKLAGETVDYVLSAERAALSRMSGEEQEMFMRLFRNYTDLLKESMDEMKRQKEEV